MKLQEMNEDQLRDNCFIKADSFEPCRVCKELTQLIEYTYEDRLCSKECQKAMDKEYHEYLIRMDSSLME